MVDEIFQSAHQFDKEIEDHEICLKLICLKNFDRVQIDVQEITGTSSQFNSSIRNILQQVSVFLKFTCTNFLLVQTEAAKNYQTAVC